MPQGSGKFLATEHAGGGASMATKADSKKIYILFYSMWVWPASSKTPMPYTAAQNERLCIAGLTVSSIYVDFMFL